MRLLPLLILAACTPIAQSGELSVHFCQVDNCTEILLSEIDGTKEIVCAFYELENDALIEALASHEVLIFDEEQHGFGTPVPARHGGLMHNKFCVLDGRRVITGSTNPTRNGLERNDNHLVIIDGKYTAANYLDELEELRGGTERAIRHPRVTHHVGNRTVRIQQRFCPEDECEAAVLSEISIAESITFMTFSFTSDPIGKLLAAKAAQGRSVRGIFERRGNSKYSEYKRLLEAGANVTFDSNPATMHHKVFILDEDTDRARVITGSYNPTQNGNTRNDENMLIIHDKELAKRFVAEFQRIRTMAEARTRQ